MEFMARLRDRPLAIVGIVLGVAIFAIVFFRGEAARKENKKLRERVIRVESKSPCTNLTTSECALKLFRALPEETRRQLKVTQSTIRALELRAAQERRALRQGQDSAPPSQPSAGGGSPGGSPDGSSPSSGSKPPGSSPAVPTSPEPPSEGDGADQGEGAPVVKTPEVTVPGVVTVPSLEVPCIKVQPIIECK